MTCVVCGVVTCSHVCGVAEHGAGSACRTVHNYYQWVPYMLVLCGLLFTLPHQLWRHLEEGRMESVARGVRDSARWGTLVTSDTISAAVTRGSPEERDLVLTNIAKYIVKVNNSRGHVKYAAGFMVCQVRSGGGPVCSPPALPRPSPCSTSC